MSQNKNPLVSVIMPFFNTDPAFLSEAINSVIQQSYPNWELLLIDDGSDQPITQHAIRQAQISPDKIHYLDHPGHENRGASASRQLGIELSRGDYIAFLDGDDIWLPKKLEEQLAIFATTAEADALYGNTEYWYGWTGKSADAELDMMPSLGVPANKLYLPPILMRKYLSSTAAIPSLCNIIIKREVFDRIGGFESAFRVVYTDQVLYAKLAINVPIFVSDKCWDRYRQHPDSSVSVTESAGHLQAARQIYLNWLEGYLRKNHIEDEIVWRNLQQAQFLCRYPKIARLWRTGRRLLKLIGLN